MSPSLNDILRAMTTIDWSFAEANTQHASHGLFPYPAKFPPQIPETLIRSLTSPGELVLDCFAGSGTTALEAARLERNSWSIDANPVGVLVTRVKSTNMTESTNSTLQTFSKLLRTCLTDQKAVNWMPTIPNVERWYAPHVVQELALIRQLIFEHLVDHARDIALAVFINVAARMSYQDSETRYVSHPRDIRKGDSVTRFTADLQRAVKTLIACKLPQTRNNVICADSRDRGVWPASESVSLVVTSPPYPNAYDYHLYHRFRIYWLGEDPKTLKSVEIGSHLKNQATNNPIVSFENDMKSVLANTKDILEIGRLAVFVVGDGLFHGASYPTAERLESLGAESGLEFIGTIDRNLPLHRRSVTPAGRRLQVEQICIFRKPVIAPPTCTPPPYRLYPYEKYLASLETSSLLNTRDAPNVKQLAFTYAWNNTHTLQALSERDPESRTKNSTYGPHGLHRYKGKFYPQLAKALVNIANPYERQGVVCDPFGGSGTVAVEASLAGLDVLSIDINPLAVEVARAKIALLQITPSVFSKLSGELLERLRRLGNTDNIQWEVLNKDVYDEVGSWFAPSVLGKLTHLLQISDSLGAVLYPAVSAVWRAIVSDIIREVSHQDPRDLRIRRRDDPLQDAPVFELFSDRLQRLVKRHASLQDRLLMGPPLGSAAIIHDTSENASAFELLQKTNIPIATVVSSPPYGVALPYLDTDRLSLSLIYGISAKSRRKLEEKLIGSREVTKSVTMRLEREIDTTTELPESIRLFLNSLRDEIASDSTAGFRKQQLPAVLARYFIGMSRVMAQLSLHMEAGAEMSLVMGDSRSTINGKTWIIPTINSIAEIGKFHGFSLMERIPITVTREGLKNAHHSITENQIVRLSYDQ